MALPDAVASPEPIDLGRSSTKDLVEGTPVPLVLPAELGADEAPLPPAVEARVQEFLQQSKSAATWKAYQADWADFLLWCQTHRRRAFPTHSDTVRGYLADRAQILSAATLQRRMAAISQVHEASGLDSPTRSLAVRETLKGVLRAKGRRPTREKKPVRVREIGAMIGSLPETAIGVRDRALLLLGFAGAFRRSELVAIGWEHLEWRDEGLAILVPRSKSDQEGEGFWKGFLPAQAHPELCPVTALKTWRHWLRRYGLPLTGPVFRQVGRRGKPTTLPLSDKAVARAVKQWLGVAMAHDRLESRELLGFSGHSLRAGFCTAAAEAGADERSIAEQSGHKSLPILRRYIRDANVLRNHAIGKLGL